MARSKDIGVDWTLFDLDWLENHLAELQQAGVPPSTKFMAALRKRRREAREARQGK